MTVTTEEKLEKLGFKKLKDGLAKARGMQKKLALAYEHFRYVKQDKIDAFNEKLRPHNKYLAFTGIEEYDKVPPTDVLDALEKAQEIGCFDSYEVAHIAEVKDPILFGRITDCPDRFFIAQWDDDVRIEDILKENEG